MMHRSIYFRDNTMNRIVSFIDKGIVANYSQAVELATSILEDYFSDDQLRMEANARLSKIKPGPKGKKEENTNE